MEDWNVTAAPRNSEVDLVLLNCCRTGIRFSRRADIDIASLMSEMEECDVPLAYTRGLEEIYFTVLRDSKHGDYVMNKVRISCASMTKEILGRTLIHELAHHVDTIEDLSSGSKIVKESKKAAHRLPDAYAKKNVGEYLAIGFEVYYVGSRKERSEMRRFNPVLWKCVESTHRKYKKM